MEDVNWLLKKCGLPILILLFPVIYFLFVTAKCLSYRGSWSLSRKRHTNGHMYYYKQTAHKTCYVGAGTPNTTNDRRGARSAKIFISS